jgi:hypothetical protein
VLKLGMPHMEARDELAGLRFWDGNPTVRVCAADDELGAMLLEHCEPGTSLRALPEPDQDVVVAQLLRRLRRKPAAPHPFRPLVEMTDYWAGSTLAARDEWLDPGVVRAGLELLAALPRNAPDEALLATDLRAGNVLRARREPWLVIDPKPFLGDPAYDPDAAPVQLRGATPGSSAGDDRPPREPRRGRPRAAAPLDVRPRRGGAAEPSRRRPARARALTRPVGRESSDAPKRVARACRHRLASGRR